MLRKTSIITGSSRGIGRAIACKLAKQGYDILINSIHNIKALEILSGELSSQGCNCIHFLGDISKYKTCEAMYEYFFKHYNHIDLLVNNAGISYVGLLQDMSFNDWNSVIQTNLSSVFSCSKLAIPHMIKSGSGKIINISSVWGSSGASCEVAYSASKGGVHAFTRALAKELAPSNIQVNAIACGAIDTDMNSCFSAEELKTIADDIPIGRFGRVDEVAELVYQISEAPDYLNGQVIHMDGAWV